MTRDRLYPRPCSRSTERHQGGGQPRRFLLYLPLDKLMQQAGGTAAAATTTGAAPAAGDPGGSSRLASTTLDPRFARRPTRP